MNVCCICMADGVVDVGGAWYCTKHTHYALLAVGEQMVLLSQPKLEWNSATMEEALIELLTEAGYEWEEDEEEDEDE